MVFKKLNGKKIPKEVKEELRSFERQLKEAEKNNEAHLINKLYQKIADFKFENDLLN